MVSNLRGQLKVRIGCTLVGRSQLPAYSERLNNRPPGVGNYSSRVARGVVGLLWGEGSAYYNSKKPLKQYVNKVNVNKVNVQVNVNKVNVKVNVNKVNGKVKDIYSIHSHYKGGGRWLPPQKRCRGFTAAAALLWFPSLSL